MEWVLFSILFVMIYIITVVIYMYITHKEHPDALTVGELFDDMDEWMFVPAFNTVALLILVLCACIYLIIEYIGIIEFWKK